MPYEPHPAAHPAPKPSHACFLGIQDGRGVNGTATLVRSLGANGAQLTNATTPLAGGFVFRVLGFQHEWVSVQRLSRAQPLVAASVARGDLPAALQNQHCACCRCDGAKIPRRGQQQIDCLLHQIGPSRAHSR
jgi:hypothetical protein